MENQNEITLDEVFAAIKDMPDLSDEQLPDPATHYDAECNYVEYTRVFRSSDGVRAEFQQHATATIAPDGTTAIQPEKAFTVPISELPARVANIEKEMLASETRGAWEDGRYVEELIKIVENADPEEAKKVELFIQSFEHPEREIF